MSKFSRNNPERDSFILTVITQISVEQDSFNFSFMKKLQFHFLWWTWYSFKLECYRWEIGFDRERERGAIEREKKRLTCKEESYWLQIAIPI